MSGEESVILKKVGAHMEVTQSNFLTDLRRMDAPYAFRRDSEGRRSGPFTVWTHSSGPNEKSLYLELNENPVRRIWVNVQNDTNPRLAPGSSNEDARFYVQIFDDRGNNAMLQVFVSGRPQKRFFSPDSFCAGTLMLRYLPVWLRLRPWIRSRRAPKPHTFRRWRGMRSYSPHKQRRRRTELTGRTLSSSFARKSPRFSIRPGFSGEKASELRDRRRLLSRTKRGRNFFLDELREVGRDFY
jgi:hypothetical protein